MNKPKNYEDAISKLEQIIQSLEDGNLPLKDATKAFQDGMVLFEYCNNELNKSDQQISRLVEEQGGNIIEENIVLDDINILSDK